MKTLLILMMCLAPFLTPATHAAAPGMEGDPRVRIAIAEPERDVGYTVGDILERRVTLTVAKPWKLVKTSLPIVGYEKRYQGQVIGIELHHSSLAEAEHDDSTTYVLQLAYQVFTNKVVAKPAALPPEVIQFAADGKTFDYRIPSWQFRISPLAVFGAVKVEQDMSPLRGPLLQSAEAAERYLRAALAVFGLALLGLLYILGAHAWLPRMGGPFARAYRRVRKAARAGRDLAGAIGEVHLALNSTAGFTVFHGNLARLYAAKPRFAAIAADLEQFFALSRRAFFEQHAAADDAAALAWLHRFCRRCRDCERGLK